MIEFLFKFRLKNKKIRYSNILIWQLQYRQECTLLQRFKQKNSSFTVQTNLSHYVHINSNLTYLQYMYQTDCMWIDKEHINKLHVYTHTLKLVKIWWNVFWKSFKVYHCIKTITFLRHNVGRLRCKCIVELFVSINLIVYYHSLWVNI